MSLFISLQDHDLATPSHDPAYTIWIISTEDILVTAGTTSATESSTESTTTPTTTSTTTSTTKSITEEEKGYFLRFVDRISRPAVASNNCQV